MSKKITKAEKILRFINENTPFCFTWGDESKDCGRSYGEIARFCCEMNGFNYDLMETIVVVHPRVSSTGGYSYLKDEKIIIDHSRTEDWHTLGCGCYIKNGFLYKGGSVTGELGGYIVGLVVRTKERRVHRGYYGTNLSTLLHGWCKKHPLTGRWHCFYVPSKDFYSLNTIQLAGARRSLEYYYKQEKKFKNYFESRGLNWYKEINK